MASLNGVYTYTKTRGAELVNTCSDDCSVVWKEYHNTFMLCIVATDSTLSSCHLQHILDLVFNTMVFYLGLEELVNVKNIERLKKDLKVRKIISLIFYYRLIYKYSAYL